MKRRLAAQNGAAGGDPETPVLPSDRATRERGQAEGVVEFAIREKAGIGGDPRTMELKLETALETGP